MDLLSAFVLAVVEGITEFLPVSSTGHMVLATRLLQIPQTTFVSTFEIGIQLGAILAVVSLYLSRIWGNKKLFLKVGTAFLPTAVVGFVMYPVVKNSLLGNADLTAVMLLLGGIALIIWEKWQRPGKTKIEELPWWKCVLIGLGQSVSMIPGVSRAMATIMTGVGMGLSRKEAVEMSFLLAVPTMMAAAGLDIYKSADGITNQEWGILIFGFCVAYVVAVVAVKWLVNFVKKSDLSGFGWYRIAVAAVWLLA
ncbi:MAG: undecaprenyl-diphosphate phosphatase [Patescibacteria group bacterium]|mgnify:CR=1 FL=1